MFFVLEPLMRSMRAYIKFPVLVMRRHVVATGVINEITWWGFATFVQVCVVRAWPKDKKLKVIVPEACQKKHTCQSVIKCRHKVSLTRSADLPVMNEFTVNVRY